MEILCDHGENCAAGEFNCPECGHEPTTHPTTTVSVQSFCDHCLNCENELECEQCASCKCVTVSEPSCECWAFHCRHDPTPPPDFVDCLHCPSCTYADDCEACLGCMCVCPECPDEEDEA